MRFFNIEALNNTYGTVSGQEDENGKCYLLLDDYSGYTSVEISKEAFVELHKQFGQQTKMNIL